uniref:Peptidase M12B propeptide domain-containing protein n=1 Tax=Plectus sambesii TaxID=2011161 RepID=A0A914VJV0_9BILA
NQALIDAVKDEHEVVFPFQQREDVRTGVNTRNYLFVNGTYHFHEITVVIRSSYGRMKLNLELNQWLIPSGATFKELQAGKEPSVTRNVENCYYQGKVQGDPSSSVAISSCAGLRGVIFTRNGTFGLVGLRGGDGGRRH